MLGSSIGAMKNAARSSYKALQRSMYGGNSPSLIIVGAQKAGTSSLFRYLDAVPGFYGSQKKEMHFFDRAERYEKGVVWYESHFLGTEREDKVFFEATPSYLYRRDVPQRIAAYDPNIKIVIILREPISRAYSAWNMYYQWARLGGPPRIVPRYDKSGKHTALYDCFYVGSAPAFDEYVGKELNLITRCSEPQEEPGILRRGLYLQQIKRYVDTFGENNVLVLGSQELSSNPLETTWKVARHASASADRPELSGLTKRHNARKYDEPISSDTRAILAEFYREDTEALWEYLGRTVNW